MTLFRTPGPPPPDWPGLCCGMRCRLGPRPWRRTTRTSPSSSWVPYPPGGPTDIVARVVAQKLQEQMGQPFVIDNKPGAGANTGAEAVARSTPDGYTLLVATTAHAINPSLFSKLSYQLLKDLALVSQLTSGPLVIVANPALPAQNIQGASIASPRARAAASISGPLAMGSPPSFRRAVQRHGRNQDVPCALQRQRTGVLTDVMAGQTDLMFDTMLSAMPHVKAGKPEALAITSSQRRSPVAPHLPTVAESACSGYEAIAWNGLLAPAGTPKEVVARLNAELKKVLENPDVRQRFEAQGFAASWNSPATFGSFLQAEVDKWAKVVQVSGAKID